MKDKYTGLDKNHFDVIMRRYIAFQEVLNDTTKDPVKVFNPLSQKSLESLELIRQVSKDLQRKKEEDMMKAAQAAANQEAEENKPETIKEEDKTEDTN